MQNIDSFVPVKGRGAALDDIVHLDLAHSLLYLSEQTNRAYPAFARSLKDLGTSLKDGRKVAPMAFRAYYKFVQAIAVGDTASAEAAMAKMEQNGTRAPERVVTYFGEPKADQIALELISDGARLAPVTDETAANFTNLLNEALALMQRTLPGLYSDVDALVREVLLARAPLGDKMEFDGSSHYQFWGHLLLNPTHHTTPLQVVEVLAHEASHSLLFGLTRQEPLVFNPDEELYASPLRKDPRPMDGIYHAAFVSARMWWAMDRISRSDLLSAQDREWAADAAEKDRENWAKGLSVIDAHARLSDTGARILDGARAAMAA